MSVTDPGHARTVMDSVSGFLLDLDGTIYLGDDVFECSADFVSAARTSGRDVVFLTNNSANDATAYAEKLTRMGIPTDAVDVVTAGDATVDHLQNDHPGATVFVLGTPSLERQFAGAGIELVENGPEIVVVGFDTTLTYEKVKLACSAMLDGAALIATHPDLVCPTREGPIPDCGSICAMITAATDAEPVVIGKPYQTMADYAMRRLGVGDSASTAMVGDRLYTDIKMANDSGMTGILVLSGETTQDMADAASEMPDIVVEHVGCLTPLLRGNTP